MVGYQLDDEPNLYMKNGCFTSIFNWLFGVPGIELDVFFLGGVELEDDDSVFQQVLVHCKTKVFRMSKVSTFHYVVQFSDEKGLSCWFTRNSLPKFNMVHLKMAPWNWKSSFLASHLGEGGDSRFRGEAGEAGDRWSTRMIDQCSGL